jgi:serine O-acetyltransferase
LDPLTLYRFAHFLWLKRIPVLPRVLKGLTFLVFHCVIPPECVIGRGTRLFHSGLGIIIHPSTTIGEHCNIYNHVVFGGGHDGPDGPPIAIVIGNHCNVAAGAKILCRDALLTIGNNVTIAANAVVLSRVPNDVVVAGVPARIVKHKHFAVIAPSESRQQ